MIVSKSMKSIPLYKEYQRIRSGILYYHKTYYNQFYYFVNYNLHH